MISTFVESSGVTPAIETIMAEIMVLVAYLKLFIFERRNFNLISVKKCKGR